MNENEPNLTQRARDYLKTIEHAVDDVGATVGRMREFYRPHETQLPLQRVQVNDLVQQVVNHSRPMERHAAAKWHRDHLEDRAGA